MSCLRVIALLDFNQQECSESPTERNERADRAALRASAGRAVAPRLFIERQELVPAAADAPLSHPGEQPVGERPVRPHRAETVHVVVQAGGFPPYSATSRPRP